MTIEHGPSEIHFLRDVSVVVLGNQRCARSCGELLRALGADVRFVRADDPYQTPAQASYFQADVLIISSDCSALASTIWSSASEPTVQIVCNITAFGVTGPLAGISMPDRLLQAVTGVAATCGYDKRPVAHTAPIIDAQAAVYAASAIIAALFEKKNTGSGQTIDLSRFDVAINSVLTFIPSELAGNEATRLGNRHPFLAPWNCFRAADGWLTICAPTDSQWHRLCEVMGTGKLRAEDRFRSSSGRTANNDALDHVIQSWVAQRKVSECIEKLLLHGIPCGPIADATDVCNEPNLKLRGLFSQATEANMDGMQQFRCPIWITESARQRSPGTDRPPRNELASVWRSSWGQSGPLRGLRVVELGSNTAGPLAAKQLGALGADVLKVESPTGDPIRGSAPFSPLGESFAFALSNTDKRGIILDLKTETDKALLHSILSDADVLIENWKPGSLERIGLGPQQLLSIYPRLTYCSISGFGHRTVYPGRPAYDIVIQGMSGLMGLTYARNAPLKTGISTSDLLAAQFGLLATLASIYQGHGGVHLDISMLDCAAWAAHALPPDTAESDVEVDIVEAGDGWVAVERTAAWESIRDPATRTIETTPRAAAVQWLEGKLGARAAPVLSVREALAHPQTQARGLLKTVVANGEDLTVLESPLRLTSTPARVRRAMPRLGESPLL